MTETALVRADPAQRSAVSYPITGDPWPVIAAWAKKHGFLPRSTLSGDVKLFQKGIGLLMAPMRAQFTQRGDRMEVQAWVHNPLLVRIMSLFILPQEMNLKSGGFRAVVPRSVARKAVNELLGQVGAELIP